MLDIIEILCAGVSVTVLYLLKCKVQSVANTFVYHKISCNTQNVTQNVSSERGNEPKINHAKESIENIHLEEKIKKNIVNDYDNEQAPKSIAILNQHKYKPNIIFSKYLEMLKVGKELPDERDRNLEHFIDETTLDASLESLDQFVKISNSPTDSLLVKQSQRLFNEQEHNRWLDEQDRLRDLEEDRQLDEIEQQRLLDEQEHERWLDEQDRVRELEEDRQLDELEQQRLLDEQEHERWLDEQDRVRELEEDRQLDELEQQRLLDEQEHERWLDEQDRVRELEEDRQLDELEQQRLLDEQEHERWLDEQDRVRELEEDRQLDELEQQRLLDEQEHERWLDEQDRVRELEEDRQLDDLEQQRLLDEQEHERWLDEQDRVRELEEDRQLDDLEQQRLLDEQEHERWLDEQDRVRELEEDRQLDELEQQRLLDEQEHERWLDEQDRVRELEEDRQLDELEQQRLLDEQEHERWLDEQDRVRELEEDRQLDELEQQRLLDEQEHERWLDEQDRVRELEEDRQLDELEQQRLLDEQEHERWLDEQDRVRELEEDRQLDDLEQQRLLDEQEHERWLDEQDRVRELEEDHKLPPVEIVKHLIVKEDEHFEEKRLIVSNKAVHLNVEYLLILWEDQEWMQEKRKSVLKKDIINESTILEEKYLYALLKASLAYKVGKDMISLAEGMPNESIFPFTRLELTTRVGGKIVLEEKELAPALQYVPSQGLPSLLTELRDFQRVLHRPPSTVDVLVTNGSQHGIYQCVELLVDPGDVVITTEYSYTGVFSALRPYEPEILGIPEDEDGMIPETLDAILHDRLSRGQKMPKVMYLIPTGNNPTGTTIPEDRRRRIYKMACKYDFLIVEDDPYMFLNYADKPPPSFLSLDACGRVVRLDSLSKVVSSGLRAGWLTAPTPLLRRAELHTQAELLHSCTLAQTILQRLLRDRGALASHLRSTRSFYLRRRDALGAALRDAGALRWSPPAAGLFHWVEVRGVRDVYNMVFQTAFNRGLMLVPGQAFLFDSSAPSPYLRLTFSKIQMKDMDTSVRLLAAIVEEEQKLTLQKQRQRSATER